MNRRGRSEYVMDEWKSRGIIMRVGKDRESERKEGNVRDATGTGIDEGK